jgi:hypothetical protein
MGESEFRGHCELMAHESILGERVERLLASLVAAAVNPWRGKGRPAVDPAKLLPDSWDAVKGRAGLRRFRDKLRGFAALHGEVIGGQ